ncbi:hypothetical protein D9758_004402 [Tetrapyrgos nigripes]|uniref:DUF6593 domain-containing protein n=1 Tax=Tetrapyrgos nigripes TaxID=182062 RepID=A0A8H5GN01_9AGAR|nr:hypothetical protein D9758_004402 [Tetrapyrgos nigripes]
MKLYLKDNNFYPILSNTYYDDSGKIVYKVHTPKHMGGTTGTTTITKVLSSPEDYSPAFMPRRRDTTTEPSAQPANSPDSDIGNQEFAIGDEDPETLVDFPVSDANSGPGPTPPSPSSDPSYRFEYIAQIDWSVVKSARFRFGDGEGKQVLATEFFRKGKFGARGRDRLFTASDGVEYKWILGTRVPELVTNDPSKTSIAKLHRVMGGIFNKSKESRSYLEVYPEGEHIVDEIFTTFIYIEKVRRARE